MMTVADLYRTEGKAELVGGEIVRLPPMGYRPGRIAGRIARSLDDYAEATGRGEAYTGTLAYIVPKLPSGRRSFSPDVSYYDGPLPANPMDFISGPPTLAVEIRGEADYGDSADARLAGKRRDYFAAGTLAVWDVDPLNECVGLYRPEDPETPVVFRRGDVAHAEPALPGWSVPVDWILG
ncbi:MAG TPA: Uma2 family endonuclease [Planctomycetaceae bacterium]|nr:Uma2 family endonuclease [Planctomycetaceae bacterium]